MPRGWPPERRSNFVATYILAAVSSSRSHRSKVALAVAVVGALLAWYSSRPSHGPATETTARMPPIQQETRELRKPVSPAAASRPADFDFYLMVMSSHAAFCADGHRRNSECTQSGNRALSIHGLWPERLKAGAYPHDCPASSLDLDPGLAADLARYMPGMRAGLHEPEWRKHGGTAGLDADAYFRAALRLAGPLHPALSSSLSTLAGPETGARDVRSPADRYCPGPRETLV